MRTEFPEPIRILSDLHLGHPGSRIASADQLRPLIEGAGTVVFNGDTLEMRAGNYRETAEGLFRDLDRLVRASGAEAVYLSGNHDNSLCDLHHLDLCGGAVLVTHGDVLFPEIAPWGVRNRRELERILAYDRKLQAEDEDDGDAFEARLRRAKRVCEFTAIFDTDVERGAFGHLHTVANVVFPPRKPLAILRVWRQQRRLAAAFCEAYRPKARFMIFGHTHFAGVWEKGGRVIVNTGGYISMGGARVAEVEGGELRVYRVLSERGRCVREAEPGRRFSIGAQRREKRAVERTADPAG